MVRFAFLWWLMILSIFSCNCWPSACLLWKNVYSDLLPIFKLDCFFFFLLSCMTSLCILDISPLSDIWLTYIFSHSVGCLCVLLLVPFAVESFSVWWSPTCLFLCQKIIAETYIKDLTKLGLGLALFLKQKIYSTWIKQELQGSAPHC